MLKYVNKGRFKTDFVDQVPLILANLYNVNIAILTRIQNSDTYSVLWINSNTATNNYVCIIKTGNDSSFIAKQFRIGSKSLDLH